MAKKKMYQRPDGLYEKKITIGDKRVTFRGKSEREVFQKIAAYSAEDAAGPLFETVAEEWYQKQQELFQMEKRSYNTLKGYRPAKNNAIDFFKGKRVKELQPMECARYAKYLASRFCGEHTVANKLSVLHLILDYACVNYNILYNPSDKVSVPDGLERNCRELPSDADIQFISTHTPDRGTDEFKGWLFCYCALYTGARRGELVPFTFGVNILPDAGIVKINRSTYIISNTPIDKSTKSKAGMREILLINEFRDKLKSLGYKGETRLFEEHGDLLTAKRLETCLQKWYKWSGCKSTPHQYRHGFITVCFEAGIEPKIIQEMAGHAQLSTTMDVYTHLRRNKLEAARNAINNIDFATGKEKREG